jgi:hypothetical protein
MLAGLGVAILQGLKPQEVGDGLKYLRLEEYKRPSGK